MGLVLVRDRVRVSVLVWVCAVDGVIVEGHPVPRGHYSDGVILQGHDTGRAVVRGHDSSGVLLRGHDTGVAVLRRSFR